MKYLTKEGKKALFNQLDAANKQLKFISENIPPGSYRYRMLRRYIDGLEFLIDAECENEKTKKKEDK